MPMGRRIVVLTILMLALAAGRAQASFHLWTISEAFSDASGNIQYVELVCPPGVDFENLLSGHTFVASQGATQHTFTFPNDLPTATGGHHLLIATAGYAALASAVTPDFTIPSGFLFTTNGTISYAEGFNVVNYATLPTDGYNSLNFPGGTVAPNTPTNFAGDVGALPNSAIADPLPNVPKGTVTIELRSVFPGLGSPLGIVQPDDGTDRMFIYEQSGLVRAVVGGSMLATPALDVSGRIIAADERGLIGMAFHPDFAHHPQVYTFTSEPTAGAADFTNVDNLAVSQSVIAEWTMTGGDPNANTIDPASRRELLRIDKPETNHNGGGMHFGPDGNLYIAVGDGGNGNDEGGGHAPGGNGQSLDYVYGKLLRIGVDRTSGSLLSANGQYAIPPDNPFVGRAGVDEIFAYGFRNPFSFSFDMDHFTTASYHLYVGDVGQNEVEEVDLLTSATAGGNFGWRVKEGTFFFSNGSVFAGPLGAVPPNLIDPIAEYDHNDGSAVIGGCVYRGVAIPGLAGTYVFGDLDSPAGGPTGRLFYLDAGGAIKEFQIGLDDRALDFDLEGISQDRHGEIYIMGQGASGGVIYKLVPAVANAARNPWTRYQ